MLFVLKPIPTMPSPATSFRLDTCDTLPIPPAFTRRWRNHSADAPLEEDNKSSKRYASATSLIDSSDESDEVSGHGGVDDTCHVDTVLSNQKDAYLSLGSMEHRPPRHFDPLSAIELVLDPPVTRRQPKPVTSSGSYTTAKSSRTSGTKTTDTTSGSSQTTPNNFARKYPDPTHDGSPVSSSITMTPSKSLLLKRLVCGQSQQRQSLSCQVVSNSGFDGGISGNEKKAPRLTMLQRFRGSDNSPQSKSLSPADNSDAPQFPSSFRQFQTTPSDISSTNINANRSVTVRPRLLERLEKLKLRESDDVAARSDIRPRKDTTMKNRTRKTIESAAGVDDATGVTKVCSLHHQSPRSHRDESPPSRKCGSSMVLANRRAAKSPSRTGAGGDVDIIGGEVQDHMDSSNLGAACDDHRLRLDGESLADVKRAISRIELNLQHATKVGKPVSKEQVVKSLLELANRLDSPQSFAADNPGKRVWYRQLSRIVSSDRKTSQKGISYFPSGDNEDEDILERQKPLEALHEHGGVARQFTSTTGRTPLHQQSRDQEEMEKNDELAVVNWVAELERHTRESKANNNDSTVDEHCANDVEDDGTSYSSSRFDSRSGEGAPVKDFVDEFFSGLGSLFAMKGRKDDSDSFSSESRRRPRRPKSSPRRLKKNAVSGLHRAGPPRGGGSSAAEDSPRKQKANGDRRREAIYPSSKTVTRREEEGADHTESDSSPKASLASSRMTANRKRRSRSCEQRDYLRERSSSCPRRGSESVISSEDLPESTACQVPLRKGYISVHQISDLSQSAFGNTPDRELGDTLSLSSIESFQYKRRSKSTDEKRSALSQEGPGRGRNVQRKPERGDGKSSNYLVDRGASLRENKKLQGDSTDDRHKHGQDRKGRMRQNSENYRNRNGSRRSTSVEARMHDGVKSSVGRESYTRDSDSRTRIRSVSQHRKREV
jgi:hypothetical protein